MRFFCLITLLILSSCSKDTFLVDQYQPNYKASLTFSNVNVNCNPMFASMISEKDALVYTGPYALYTIDAFSTFKYFKYDYNVSCYKKVSFFDGNYAWICMDDSQTKYSYNLIQEDNRNRIISNSELLKYQFSIPQKSTALFSRVPLFLDSISFLFAGNEIQNSQSRIVDIFQGNVISQTATKISEITNIPSNLTIDGIFRTNDLVLFMGLAGSFGENGLKAPLKTVAIINRV